MISLPQLSSLLQSNFTELFHRGQAGDLRARNKAFGMVFVQLRSTAASMLRRESRGHTLQPTALVSELFLRFHQLQCQVLGQDHFLALAARTMRRALIDHARGKAVRRRLAPYVSYRDIVQPQTDRSITARQVWQRLRELDPLAAEAAWLQKAEGLSLKEVAQRQGRPLWRVNADIDFALDWMGRQLGS